MTKHSHYDILHLVLNKHHQPSLPLDAHIDGYGTFIQIMEKPKVATWSIYRNPFHDCCTYKTYHIKLYQEIIYATEAAYQQEWAFGTSTNFLFYQK